MKKMKSLLLLALCTMATGFMSSCLGSDDDGFDNRFTEEELSTYLNRLNGEYSGKVLFYYRGRNKVDTRDSMMLDSIENMRWTINRDSTIIIKNFPDNIYHNAITGNSDFRNVLASAPARELKCSYAPYKARTQSGAADYGFLVLPDGTVKDNARYTTNQIETADGKKYDVEYGYVTYHSDGYYSYYQANGYLTTTNAIDFMLIMTDIQCPGTQSFRTEAYPVLLKGRKM